jgi:hypothetical protein
MNGFLRIAGRIIPGLSILVATIACVMLVCLILAIIFTGSGPQQTGVLDLIENLAGAMALFFMLIVAVITYLFLPGLIAIILALPAALTWRQPRRMLVLRSFGRDDGSRELRKTLRQVVSPHGHIYTLADRDITVPWYIRYPVVFTQLAFLYFRERRLNSPESVERHLAHMDVIWARNLNWVVSRAKTFPLRCSEQRWQSVVQALSGKVDAILVDVSRPSQNLLWEVHECVARGLVERTIFLSQAACVDEAVSFLNTQVPEGVGARQLVVYDTADAQRLPAMLESAPRREIPSQKIRAHLMAAALLAGPIVWLAALAVAGIAWANR